MISIANDFLIRLELLMWKLEGQPIAVFAREPMVTRMPTATIGIATAKWRQRLVTKDIRDGPRRCHDGGRAGDYS